MAQHYQEDSSDQRTSTEPVIGMCAIDVVCNQPIRLCLTTAISRTVRRGCVTGEYLRRSRSSAVYIRRTENELRPRPTTHRVSSYVVASRRHPRLAIESSRVKSDTTINRNLAHRRSSSHHAAKLACHCQSVSSGPV